MKRVPLLPVAILLIASARVLAAPVAADSRISAVTVYADRAVVTRTASVDLTATGSMEVTFDKLPAGLVDQSLQASGRGTAQASLLDVTARATYVDFTPNDRVKALEDQLRDVARQERALDDRATVLGEQRDFVLKIAASVTAPAKDATSAPVTPETWQKLITFTGDQLTKIAADLQALDPQREDLRAQHAALEKQLAELRGQGGRSYKTVTVRLSVATAGQLDLTLRYAIPGAGWTPLYDARMQSSARTVQLTYTGLVHQSTGEDWHDVDVTLSTARPSLGGAAPELGPWIVQPQEFLPARSGSDEETIVLSPFEVTKAEGRSRPKRPAPVAASLAVAPAPTVVQNQITSATFHTSEKANIPSDNAPHQVPIATISLQAEPRYQATPKLVPAAFLTADVTNNSDYPLLAGAMNVFLDETFVAASRLRTVMPGEKFELALGADEGIAVARKLNNRLVENTGLVNRGQRITYDYTLSAQNNRKIPVSLVLLDQIPVSRHEKIVVKLLAPENVKPAADGTIKWTLTLQPGEKRELPLKFSVEHPDDLPVAGLE